MFSQTAIAVTDVESADCVAGSTGSVAGSTGSNADIPASVPSDNAHAHAVAFLAWLVDSQWPAGERILLARDATNGYLEFCAETNRQPWRWALVSYELSLLCGDRRRPRKSYCWHREDDGRKRRLRFFLIPLRMP